MEHWAEIEGFPGYDVSDQGRIRSHWYKQRKSHGYGAESVYKEKPYVMSQSNDGNGYMKVFLHNHDTGKRRCVKVHRLVAETFVPGRDDEHDTVDHIKSGPEGKLDNSVKNLRWISRRENIQKAYYDGVCDERIRLSKKPIIVHDEWTGEELYFPSVREAADVLRINQTYLSHNLNDGKTRLIGRRFWAEFLTGKDRLLYDEQYYSEQLSWLCI